MAVVLVARHVPDGGHGGHQGDESEPVRTDTGSRKERTPSHEPIISRELSEKVQQVRNERARKPQVYGARPRPAYLLSGAAVCSACGLPLWANTTTGRRHNYYRCSSRSRGEDCPDATLSCRAEHPEDEVSGLFVRLELPPAWRERVKELVSTGGAGPGVDRERQRLSERVARVSRGLIDGILDNETARAAIREAEAATHALPRPDGASVQAGESLTGIRELWPLMTGEERRDLGRITPDQGCVTPACDVTQNGSLVMPKSPPGGIASALVR